LQKPVHIVILPKQTQYAFKSLRQFFIVTLAGRRTNSIQEYRIVSAVLNTTAVCQTKQKKLPNIPIKISNTYKFRFPARLQEFDDITIICLWNSGGNCKRKTQCETQTLPVILKKEKKDKATNFENMKVRFVFFPKLEKF